jgi:hypothetical protein
MDAFHTPTAREWFPNDWRYICARNKKGAIMATN